MSGVRERIQAELIEAEEHLQRAERLADHGGPHCGKLYDLIDAELQTVAATESLLIVGAARPQRDRVAA